MSELTNLQKTILLLYSMQDSDITSLEGELLTALKRAWKTALTEKARQYGCNKQGRDPSRGDLDDLKRMASEDAKSIAATYNRELENRIIGLYKSNPRANRYYYIDNLEAWANQRSQYKTRQISVQTEQKARVLAQDAFRLNNGLRGKLYRYVGPPPISEICQRRTAMGLVSESTARQNPTPAHPGPCVHEWVEQIDERIPCDEIWVG